jgi:hypothetical protein
MDLNGIDKEMAIENKETTTPVEEEEKDVEEDVEGGCKSNKLLNILLKNF